MVLVGWAVTPWVRSTLEATVHARSLKSDIFMCLIAFIYLFGIIAIHPFKKQKRRKVTGFLQIRSGGAPQQDAIAEAGRAPGHTGLRLVEQQCCWHYLPNGIVVAVAPSSESDQVLFDPRQDFRVLQRKKGLSDTLSKLRIQVCRRHPGHAGNGISQDFREAGISRHTFFRSTGGEP